MKQDKNSEMIDLYRKQMDNQKKEIMDFIDFKNNELKDKIYERINLSPEKKQRSSKGNRVENKKVP